MKKSTRIFIWIFTGLFLVWGNVALGQNDKSHIKIPKNWVFRFSMGKTQFYGDASHDDKWEKLMTESRLSYSGSARKQCNKFLGFGSEMFYSKVRSRKGLDNKPVPLQHELASYYVDLNLFMFIDLSALVFRDGFLHRFSAFATGGFGYAFWKSTLTDIKTGEEKHSGHTYNGQYYSKGSPMIPLTFGFKFAVNYEWLIYVDVQMRTILNDQLDVWVGGSPFDFLFNASLGVSYRLNYPKWPLSKKSKQSKMNQRFLERVYYKHH